MIDALNPGLRVTSNREFFVMKPEEACELLEAIANISGTKDKLKRIHIPVAQKQTVRRPPVNFAKCGIPVGAKLVYTEDPTVVAIVVGERKVQYPHQTVDL